MAGGVFATAALTKVFFQLDPAKPVAAPPVYGLAIGVFIVIAALTDRSSRGLVFMGLGAVLSAAAAVALIPHTPASLLVWVAGVPLIIPGSVGLAAFAHSYLHGRPAVGDRGLQLVAIGAAASVASVCYVATILWIRGQVHGTATGTALVAVAGAFGLLVMVAGIVVGRRAAR